MTFTKESNKEMEKVMMLMDMGILPLEDKDGVNLEKHTITDDELFADYNAEYKEFLFRDKTYGFSWKDMFGEEHYEYGEKGCFANQEHYEYTLEKNRRAKRRRQMHKHKNACVNGKTVKAYGKEGKLYLNHNERLYGKQIWLNGKFADDVKETEKFAEVMADFAVDEEFKALMEMKHYYDDYDAAMERWEKECEVLDFFCDNADKFAEREIFGNYLPPCKLFERIDSFEWVKKFKDFLSLEEVLDMFF